VLQVPLPPIPGYSSVDYVPSYGQNNLANHAFLVLISGRLHRTLRLYEQSRDRALFYCVLNFTKGLVIRSSPGYLPGTLVSRSFFCLNILCGLVPLLASPNIGATSISTAEEPRDEFLSDEKGS
jgi:hypothetical protein